MSARAARSSVATKQAATSQKQQAGSASAHDGAGNEGCAYISAHITEQLITKIAAKEPTHVPPLVR